MEKCSLLLAKSLTKPNCRYSPVHSRRTMQGESRLRLHAFYVRRSRGGALA